MNEDIIEQSSTVRKTANRLIGEMDLINILSNFGKVKVVGSYKYNLMWGPDIDVIVISDEPRKASMEALVKLVDARVAQKYEYGDFAKFKREKRPESYILNLILPFNNREWEIEIWFFDKMPNSQIEMDNLIEEKLNKKNMVEILEMKKEREKEGLSKHLLSSADIYKKVLSSNE